MAILWAVLPLDTIHAKTQVLTPPAATNVAYWQLTAQSIHPQELSSV